MNKPHPPTWPFTREDAEWYEREMEKYRKAQKKN